MPSSGSSSPGIAVAESKLVLDGLHKEFPGPLPVLDGVEFDVAPGEFVSVIGPSGCGKSTLFNVIAGLERPDAGRVLVDGEDATGRVDHFAYMPQRDLLFPWRTVLDNTTLGLEVAGMSRREARERARPLFAPFGLDVASPAVQAGIYTVALVPNVLGYGLLAARAGRGRVRTASEGDGFG